MTAATLLSPVRVDGFEVKAGATVWIHHGRMLFNGAEVEVRASQWRPRDSVAFVVEDKPTAREEEYQEAKS